MGEQTASEATLIVIFGITGDLAKRKLLPALYHLTRDNLLHAETQIIGVTRQKLTKKAVLEPLEKYSVSHSRPSPAALRRFSQAFHLFTADLAHAEDYRKLHEHLRALERQSKTAYRRVYYLSVPPSVMDEVVGFMGEAGLAAAPARGHEPRLLIEKPFGYDMVSARSVVRSVRRHFAERQVYRVDHYLAKEMAQNILHFRFHNPLFETIWTREHIKRVEVIAYEKIGIEGRVNFYEQTGALRDLIQSHLLFLMSLVAMERPRSLTSRAVHTSRKRLLKQVATPEPYEVGTIARRGQYRSYRQEVGARTSATETYAAVRLKVDNDRWRDVPFVLKTGKAMAQKLTCIRLHFSTNLLELRLQPDEAIELSLHVKEPGHAHRTVGAAMDFSYRRSFSRMSPPEAYENVLLDAIHGERLLFADSEEILHAWRIVQPILDEWEKSAADLVVYQNGAAVLPRRLDI